MPDRYEARTHVNQRGRVRTSSAGTTENQHLKGILVTNLVTRRQTGPLDGVRRKPDFLGNSSDSLLGYLDSNQEQLNQNQPCYRYTIPQWVRPRSGHPWNSSLTVWVSQTAPSVGQGARATPVSRGSAVTRTAAATPAVQRSPCAPVRTPHGVSVRGHPRAHRAKLPRFGRASIPSLAYNPVPRAQRPARPELRRVEQR